MFSILRVIRAGRVAVDVVDAIKAERNGETDFWKMSRDIGEAFVEYATDDGLNITDDEFAGAKNGRYPKGNFDLLVRAQQADPTPGKANRIKQIRRQRRQL